MKTTLQLLVLLTLFTATARAADYQQPPAHRGGLSADGSAFTVADDFVLPDLTAIASLTWWGGYLNGPVAPDSFLIRFYADDGGRPGSLLPQPVVGSISRFLSGSVQDGMSEYQYTAIMDTPFVAQAGERYWLSIANNVPVQLGQGWNWELSANAADPGVQLFFDGSWHSHAVIGAAFAVPEPSALALMSCALMAFGFYMWRLRLTMRCSEPGHRITVAIQRLRGPGR